MAQILMLQSIVRPWRAGEAGRMFEAGRRYSDTPVAGVSLGPVDTAVLARLVSEGFARGDAMTVSLAGETVAPGGFVRGGAPLGPARPALTPDGTLINPATGARPAAGQPFTLLGGAIGGLRITVPDTATADETITITGTLRDGTTWTAAGTLAPGDSEDWPINRLGLASLSWASTGPSAYVEPM